MKKIYKGLYDELKKELKVDSFVWWAKPVASLIVVIRMINHWLLKDDKKMSVKTDTQYLVVKELQNVQEYVDNLSYEEWKQVAFSVLHFGSITQRNLMRCIYLDNVNGRKIDEDLISYAFELSQSLHGLPGRMLEISSAESLFELKEVFDVHEGFIDSSKRFLAETIQVLIMLDYQFGYGNGVVAFRIDSLLGWSDFVARKGEAINAD